MASTHEDESYPMRELPVPVTCHNRYLNLDISAFEHVLPKYRQDFWDFTQKIGYRGMAHHIDQACLTNSILPPNREVMNGVYYQYCLDKYLTWDPRDKGKTLEAKIDCFRRVMGQRDTAEAEHYWTMKKANFPTLDCENPADDSDEDHPGYYNLWLITLEGPKHPGFEDAMWHISRLSSASLDRIKELGGESPMVSTKETFSAKKRRIEREIQLTRAEATARNKIERQKRRDERRGYSRDGEGGEGGGLRGKMKDLSLAGGEEEEADVEMDNMD